MILIKPSVHAQSQNALITPFIYKTFPTSLGYLAGYIRAYNKIVPQIIDEEILPLERYRLEEILRKDQGPKIIGMSVITINISRAFRLAEMAKSIDNGYMVIFGGIHPTALPEECLNSNAVDVVVRGEGEVTLSEIIMAVNDNKDLSLIKGISYKKDGKIFHNDSRPLTDISSVPSFPYDLFDATYKFYRDFGTVISSRGCRYECIFCSQRIISGQRYRYVPSERVLGEIEILVEKYKQEKIWFMDDNFLGDEARAASLLEEIIRRGFHKKAGFCAEMRAEAVTYGILKKMKEANFYTASFGMETGSQRLLDLIKKKEKIEDNVRAIKMAHEAGIGTSATFIFGLPTETRSERLHTAKLARELPLDDARFNVAVPYPGTELFAIAKEENCLKIREGWSNFNVQSYMFQDDIPYVPRGTDKNELIYDTFMANLKFYLRIRTLAKLFASPIFGGMVLTLPKRWYLSPSHVSRLFRLAMLVLKRFLTLIFYRWPKTAVDL